MREPDQGAGGWYQYPLMSAVWHARCTGAEKSVLVCMAWHAKPGGGDIYPGIRRLAKLTGYSRSTVENAVAALIGRGYVTIVRAGNQVRPNRYRINVAKLLENATDGVPGLMWDTAAGEPEPAAPLSLLPGQGVARSPGQVSREVSRYVSLSTPKPVPVAGTEQTTTHGTHEQEEQKQPSREEAEGEKLWSAALELLRSRLGKQNFETWIRPIRAGTLSGSNLTLNLPSGDFAHVVEAINLYVLDALRTTAQTLGLSLEGVTPVWPETDESSPESMSSAQRRRLATLSPPSAQRWRRSG